MNIEGSVALVTGANRGLGARLVERLLDAGARRVYATARDPRSVAATVSTDPRVNVLALDVTDQSSVDAAAKTATDVTMLVNNAGVLGFGGALDGDLDLFQRDVATNYVGLLRVSRAFVPVLTANAPGAIVNVLTLIALAPVGGMAGYCASKAAAHSATQSMRAELRGRGIEVIGAYPGGIDTDMLAGVDADKAAPEVVAERIITGVAAGRTVIWPDDASAGAGSVYSTDPLALEVMLAG
ncbi:short-chain dehydrogenase [Parafrankia colletiae]|uniref:Short-chain dehydrogenase n=1 Tax=Parafrankia colletiae TaxID=573497 RepID=A0A1S1QS23_9ACTN|nr:SDR family NAD(P)-dependent oxidoreductase [Parafrankia colletiae]MCK9901845.1 SDR family NAD(P)-dependent oxidoreductase [Frankia sp. Cpl3]OHV36507.1 short-chain dehydrogenase [Parafrankia colletiae]